MLFYVFCKNGMEPVLAIVICIAVCCITSYLLGSLNFGIIFSKKLYKEDVRSKGSGNAGSTNMLRNYGKSAGILTFLCDCAKTALSVAIGLLFYAHFGMFLSGLMCIIGHMFPVFYGFKGGKGVACFTIVVLMTSIYIGRWYMFLIVFAMFAIIVVGTKFVSLGSVICSLVYPVLLNRLNGAGSPFRSVEVIAVIMSFLIIYKHKDNIKRLIEGKENKISFGKKKGLGND